MRADNKFDFESDMESAIYNAIGNVCFKYRNCNFSEDEIITAVDRATAWWESHFFDDFYTEE